MNRWNRRHFLRVTFVGITSSFLPVRHSNAFSFFKDPIKKIIPFSKMKVLSAKEFYVQSLNEKPPKISVDEWVLRLEGLFKNPFQLNYNDIKKRASVVQMTTLACIGNEVGGLQIGNANWTGCRLKDILMEAGLEENAKKIIFFCEDLYSTAIDLPSLMSDNVLLAYAMNGKPLSREHGYPVRLIIPGRYGMKNPKWIRRIVATEEDYKGYYEKFGWSDTAEMQIITRIDDTMQNHTLRGVALNGKNRIDKVEISLDGGQTWNAADLEQTKSPYVWSLWSYDVGGIKGKIEVVCRAKNEYGEIQDEAGKGSFPAGASAPDRQRFRIL